MLKIDMLKYFATKTCCLVLMTIVLLLVDCTDSNPVASNHRIIHGGKEDSFAVDFMIRYGYLSQPDPRLAESRTRSALVNAIKSAQRFAGLEVTGTINKETVELMQSRRCGMPDFGPSDNMRRKKRYALHSTKWFKKDLTYRIINKPVSNKISESEVHKHIAIAFRMWSEVSQLTFKKLHHGIADIMISFQTAQHDDAYPFDGEGGTLAHGFFPHDNEGISGDVHFDDDEVWVLGPNAVGTDFFWTAVHEIGHAIGLDHSYYRDAIMYPYYRGYKEDLKLNEDDKIGIQMIYGKPMKIANTLPPATTTTKPVVKNGGPDACRTSVDAVFHSRDGETFFFKEEHFWKLDQRNRISGPFKLQENWPQLRSRVQAAYTRPDGKTVFFKGRRFWVYDGTRYIEGPKVITEYGLPIEMKRLDAVFVWGGNRKTYFFKEDKYWRYNEITRKIDPGYPRNITDGWGSVPQPIDSVMTWRDGDTYFFNEHTFLKHDFYNQHQVMVGKNIGNYFMGCNDKRLEPGFDPRSGASSTLVVNLVLVLCSIIVTLRIF